MRRRDKQLLSSQDRFVSKSKVLGEGAEAPAAPERDELLKKAEQPDMAASFGDLSPGERR